MEETEPKNRFEQFVADHKKEIALVGIGLWSGVAVSRWYYRHEMKQALRLVNRDLRRMAPSLARPFAGTAQVPQYNLK